MKTFGVVSLEPLDSLLLAALRHSPLEVVSLASSQLSNWWLAAHLADLLQHRDTLHNQPELVCPSSPHWNQLHLNFFLISVVAKFTYKSLSFRQA